jgi:hypothetical protein
VSHTLVLDVGSFYHPKVKTCRLVLGKLFCKEKENKKDLLQ